MTSRLRSQHTPLRDQEDFVRAKLVIQAAVARVQTLLPVIDPARLGVERYGPLEPGSADARGRTDNQHLQYAGHDGWLPPAPGGSAFAYSLVYVYYAQYGYIRGVAVSAVMLAIGAVFSALLLVSSLAVAASTALLVASVTASVVAWVWMLNPHGPPDGFGDGPYGVDVNAVFVVNIMTATGLCVEFLVHLVSTFAAGARAARAKAGGGALSREARVAQATAATVEMGSSVVTGITLTKLVGVLILAFAPSQLFRLYYFRIYLGIIVMGAFHGLMLLPVLLATFGLPEI
jgi:Niemann-Pick C1 protein